MSVVPSRSNNKSYTSSVRALSYAFNMMQNVSIVNTKTRVGERQNVQEKLSQYPNVLAKPEDPSAFGVAPLLNDPEGIDHTYYTGH